MTPSCAVPTCSRSARVRGWCVMHYRRWLRTGDPEHRRVRQNDKMLAAIRRAKVRSAVDALRANTLCAHCGKPMQHWHNPEHTLQPYRRIATMVGQNRALSAVLDEIARCTPLCHRCHFYADNRMQYLTRGVGSGAANPGAAFTDEQIASIGVSTESNKSLSIRYGVDDSTISRIRTRKTYVVSAKPLYWSERAVLDQQAVDHYNEGPDEDGMW